MQQCRNAHFIHNTWCKQKHGDNGWQVTFGKAVYGKLCPVLAEIWFTNSTQRRFIRGIRARPYQGQTGQESSARSSHTCLWLYYSRGLSKFTSHSFRVGAYVLLREVGRTATFIKDQLHWKSESFMEYLRDAARLTKQHAISLIY